MKLETNNFLKAIEIVGLRNFRATKAEWRAVG